VVLAVLVLRHATAPQIVPTKYQMVQAVSGTDQVTYNPPPKAAPPHASPFHVPRSKQKPRVQEQDVSGTGTALETLRAHAKAATAGLMVGIKQRLIYGFSTNDYKLAIQTSGAIPVISANDLPPRFEQYLIVEVTIDTDGRVADARLTAGMATPKIEQTLLSAIREFKYIPAKRDGTPIPCQIDLVIHIPS
jgi:TonB family protein